jgi:hypothetical protein
MPHIHECPSLSRDRILSLAIEPMNGHAIGVRVSVSPFSPDESVIRSQFCRAAFRTTGNRQLATRNFWT